MYLQILSSNHLFNVNERVNEYVLNLNTYINKHLNKYTE